MRWMLICKKEELPPPQGPFPEPTPEQQTNFFVRLGMALSAWQITESSLVAIYAYAVRTSNYAGVAASFHVPISFKVRLDMTNEAVQRSGIDDYGLRRWNKLYTKISRKNSRRNQFAHSVVCFDPKRKPKSQLFLAPPPSNPNNSIAAIAPSDVISASDLEAMLLSFEKLNQDMWVFLEEVLWKQVPRPGQQLTSDKRPHLLRRWANALVGRFSLRRAPPPPSSEE